MDPKWIESNGDVRYTVGFVVHPENGTYIGYKLFPSFGHRERKRKPRVELCVGLLQRIYDPDDQYLLLRSRKVTSGDFPTDRVAGQYISDLIVKRAMDGWVVLSPAYPRTLLSTPWKHIRKIRL